VLLIRVVQRVSASVAEGQAARRRKCPRVQKKGTEAPSVVSTRWPNPIGIGDEVGVRPQTRPVCYAGVVWLTSRRMDGYTITIELTQTGFVLRANPESASAHSPFGAFYGGQTGLITCDRSGKPARLAVKRCTQIHAAPEHSVCVRDCRLRAVHNDFRRTIRQSGDRPRQAS
jgi:hypothetical protein